ncbi:MAG: ribosome silencing factor [Anaerolineae bacterium]|nr:ribosome silencing factor [Anaerolineae bacterium]
MLKKDNIQGGGTLQSLELAHKAVDIIVEKKGLDILLLDITPVSLLADYFILASGDSERQIKAIIEEIETQVKHDLRAIPLHVDGEPDSGWVILDYGGVIIHIFSPEVRAYYRLEEMWNEARVVVKLQ